MADIKYEQIHASFIGAQDTYITESLHSYKFESERLISKNIIIFPAHENAYRHTYSFPLKRHENDNIGYTNLKIEGNFSESEIDTMELNIGGWRIVRVAEKHDNYLSFSLVDNNIIPASQKYFFELTIEHKCEAKISYDIVEIKNPIDIWEMLIKQIQFTGPEIILGGHNNIRLNFNHPVEKIIINADIPIMNPIIKLDETHIIPCDKIDDCHYQCLFGKTINFSIVKHAFIEFDCPNSANENSLVRIYAHSLNILKSQQETKLLFSN